MDGFPSILLPVPEVEGLVDPLRRTGDWSHEHGVPAHMTIAGPWPWEVDFPTGTLAEAARELRGTRYELGSAGVLGTAFCLFPSDEMALLAWRLRALDLVGVPDRLDEDWRMHLTVSRHGWTPDEADATLGTLRSALSIACEVGDLLHAELDGAGNLSLRPL